MKSVSLRRMNQDGLENFFGNVRSNCNVKNQPMAFQFRSAFTNLVVNNLTAKHSISSNCQDDKGFALLQDVFDIYDEDLFEESEEIFEDDEDIIELDLGGGEEVSNILADESLMFESSNVCRQVLASNKCIDCENTLEAYCPLGEHGILKQCEVSSNPENHLFSYPTALFTSQFKLLFKKVQTILPFICHEKLLSQKLVSYLGSDVLEGLGCSIHCSDIAQKIKKIAVNENINILRKDINKILRKKIIEPVEGQHAIYSKAFKTQKKGVGKHIP